MLHTKERTKKFHYSILISTVGTEIENTSTLFLKGNLMEEIIFSA
jgi:hypothetical protein